MTAEHNGGAAQLARGADEQSIARRNPAGRSAVRNLACVPLHQCDRCGGCIRGFLRTGVQRYGGGDRAVGCQQCGRIEIRDATVRHFQLPLPGRVGRVPRAARFIPGAGLLGQAVQRLQEIIQPQRDQTDAGANLGFFLPLKAGQQVSVDEMGLADHADNQNAHQQGEQPRPLTGFDALRLFDLQGRSRCCGAVSAAIVSGVCPRYRGIASPAALHQVKTMTPTQPVGSIPMTPACRYVGKGLPTYNTEPRCITDATASR